MTTCIYDIITRDGKSKLAGNTACFAQIRDWGRNLDDCDWPSKDPVAVKYYIAKGTCAPPARAAMARVHQNWMKQTMLGTLCMKWAPARTTLYHPTVTVSCNHDPRAVFNTLVQLRQPHEFTSRTRAMEEWHDLITVPEVGIMLFQYLSHGLRGVRLSLPGQAHTAVSRCSIRVSDIRRMVKHRHDPWYIEKGVTLENKRVVLSREETGINWYYCKEKRRSMTLNYSLSSWLAKRLRCSIPKVRGWGVDLTCEAGTSTLPGWPVLTREKLRPVIEELEEKVRCE